MQHWYLVVFFLGIGGVPAWNCYLASRTGEARVPAGFSKYGISGIETATRAENRALYNKIRALQLTAAVTCFLGAGMIAFGS